MAKRKRGNKPSAEKPVRSETNPSRSKLSVNSFEDIPDSEDEFHINRDKVLLDETPEAKRRRKWQQEDEFLEPSDEEVLAYSDQASNNDPDYSELDEEEFFDGVEARNGLPKAKVTAHSDDEDVENDEDQEEGWGTSRPDYYDADVIETEQDALDEETEALRIQQKQLKTLKESDFAFDEEDWLQDGKATKRLDIDGDDQVVTEILPQMIITEQMSVDERMKLLRLRYPEFEPFSKELLELRPLHERLAREAQAEEDARIARSDMANKKQIPITITKYQALSAYLGALAMYFAILSSTAQASISNSLPMPPTELREHDIMTSLIQCRDVWLKVKDSVDPAPEWSPDKSSLLSSDPSESALQLRNEWNKELESRSSLPESSSPSVSAALSRRKERLRRTEENLATLSSLTTLASNVSKSTNLRTSNDISTILAPTDDLDSDIGDEPALAPHEAAAKAHKKKSLRFYTSQIAQKANKRANAGRMAGGDDDIPYRERFRDRQIRLNELAEKRGKRDVEDDQISDGEEVETNLQRQQREEEAGTTGDQYSQWLEERTRATKAQRQAEKLRRAEAYAAEHGGAVVEHESEKIGPDGRRQIGYTIEKNKGMTPRRRKEVKNPRVKKRMKYEEKKKKLGSMKPVYKGGEGRGGYGGELTGIKKGLVRSVKL